MSETSLVPLPDDAAVLDYSGDPADFIFLALDVLAVAAAEPVEPPEPSPPRLGDVRVVAPSRASGSATGTAGSTASFRRGSRNATRTSGVAVAAPVTTRNENGRTADVSGVDGTAAPTTAAS